MTFTRLAVALLATSTFGMDASDESPSAQPSMTFQAGPIVSDRDIDERQRMTENREREKWAELLTREAAAKLTLADQKKYQREQSERAIAQASTGYGSLWPCIESSVGTERTERRLMELIEKRVRWEDTTNARCEQELQETKRESLETLQKEVDRFENASYGANTKLKERVFRALSGTISQYADGLYTERIRGNLRRELAMLCGSALRLKLSLSQVAESHDKRQLLRECLMAWKDGKPIEDVCPRPKSASNHIADSLEYEGQRDDAMWDAQLKLPSRIVGAIRRHADRVKSVGPEQESMIRPDFERLEEEEASLRAHLASKHQEISRTKQDLPVKLTTLDAKHRADTLRKRHSLMGETTSESIMAEAYTSTSERDVQEGDSRSDTIHEALLLEILADHTQVDALAQNAPGLLSQEWWEENYE